MYIIAQFFLTKGVMKVKKKDTSVEIRDLVIRHYKEGITQQEISDIVKVKRPTVQKILVSYNATGSIENKKGRGRKPIFSNMENQAIIRMVDNNPKFSAPKISNEMEPKTGRKLGNLLL